MEFNRDIEKSLCLFSSFAKDTMKILNKNSDFSVLRLKIVNIDYLFLNKIYKYFDFDEFLSEILFYVLKKKMLN